MTPPNCIKIVFSTNQHSYRVASQHPFFLHTTEVLTSYRGGVLTITRPTIDYQGKTYRVCVPKSSRDHRLFHIAISQNVPLGMFEIDEEESNEDKLVVYLE
jgi:hypothetical protein